MLPCRFGIEPIWLGVAYFTTEERLHVVIVQFIYKTWITGTVQTCTSTNPLYEKRSLLFNSSWMYFGQISPTGLQSSNGCHVYFCWICNEQFLNLESWKHNTTGTRCANWTVEQCQLGLSGIPHNIVGPLCQNSIHWSQRKKCRRIISTHQKWLSNETNTHISKILRDPIEIRHDAIIANDILSKGSNSILRDALLANHVMRNWCRSNYKFWSRPDYNYIAIWLWLHPDQL